MKKGIIIFAAVFFLMTVQSAFAIRSYLNTFNTKYGTLGTTIDSCGICHVNPAGGGTRNGYGNAFAGISTHSTNASGAYTTLEPLDSDGDGYTNITEINARTNPGDKTSYPAPVTTDTTAPTVTVFTIPSTSSSLTISIGGITATDNVGVTGYIITQSATKPAANATGWSTTVPASYAVSASGSYTLYAYAKDLAGNVSTGKSATVTVSIPIVTDTTAPSVTAFTVPSTYSALTVPITSFVVTDNVGVAGYMVTRSSTKPSATATGWSTTVPGSYTVSATGTYSLYGYAKDKAGNVSSGKLASVTVSMSSGVTTSISGVVKDITTKAVISGAIVSDGTHTAKTNTKGVYILPETAGNYTLSITRSGYLTTTQIASVESGKTTTVNWALVKKYGTQTVPAAKMSYVILAWNDLGMHCDQNDYSYFMVLPPFNTIRAQIFKRGGEGAQLVTSGVTVSYSFPKKKNSALHTNFWKYASQFGYDVPENVGITGTRLSGNMNLDANGIGWEAVGIPITPYDDDGTWDPYGTAVITVKDSTGKVLQTANVVAPVSTEMMCTNCHGDGTNNQDAMQLSILQVHDDYNGTTFVADRANGKVHACFECHADNVLGEPGVEGIPNLSLAMHNFHKDKMNMNAKSSATVPGCYNCHPGSKTQCMRGIMAKAGKTCSDCHGDMDGMTNGLLAGREPWIDMPTCGSCHSASYSENPGTLYRDSVMMNAPEGMNGIIYCEACHNSTHAEFITSNAADPTIPKKFQGDNYWIWNCRVCHSSQTQGKMHNGLPKTITIGTTNDD